MPELPEVEAARAAIAAHCVGKKIIRAVIANDTKVVDGVSPPDFESSLLNKTIVAAHRKGKNMWIQLDSPPFPSFQFGMTGAVYIKGVAVTAYKRSAVNDSDEWPSKFSKFFIELNDGLEMSFTDKRRFAKIRLLHDVSRFPITFFSLVFSRASVAFIHYLLLQPASVPPISELGPDALLAPMTEMEFHNSLCKKKIAIKTLLLDQNFISGIGNWIADEVLYQARIHPLQAASSISKEDSSRLLKCIKEVLEKAVEVGADSDQYPRNWIVHSRETKPGKAFVDGKKIDFISVGGRTTAYVPELQKLNGEQASKAPAKPRKEASKKSKGSDDNGLDSEDSDDATKGMSNVNSKQVRNSKARVVKPPSNKKSIRNADSDDDVGEEEKAAKTSSRTANAKRKLQEKSKAGLKKGKTDSNLKKSTDSDASNSDADDDDDEEDGNQKRPQKSAARKPQKPTKKKAQ